MKNHLDLYSVPVNFTYRNYYLFPSICGGIISIIVELLLLAYLIYLLIDMSNREFPDLGISTIYNHNPSSIYIKEDPTYTDDTAERPEIPREWNNESYWYIAFGIKDGNSVFQDLVTDKSNFTVTVINRDSNDGNEISIPHAKCKKFGNGFVSENQYNKLKFVETQCVNGGYSFQGIYGFKNAKWLEIQAKLKNPDTQMIDFKFEFYYQSRNLNITNFAKDISVSIVEEVFWDLIKDKTKISNLELSMDLIETNDAFMPRFINRFYKKLYFLTSKSWTDQTIDTDGGDNQTLLILRIFLDRISTRTERAFLDVISQFAMVGGLTGVLFPVGFLFVYAIRNFKMNESMMNDCYSIVDPTKKTAIDPFDEFLMRHYNKLMRNFEERRYVKSIKKTDDEVILKGGNSTTNELQKSSFSDSKKKKVLIQINDDLNDDEGLNDNDWNPLEVFFTLKRIEDLFNISYQDRIKIIKETPAASNIKNKRSKSTANQKIMDEELACQYTENLQFDKVKQAEYICYQFLYESCVYKIQPHLRFNVFELFHYFIFEMCCCRKKREIENQMLLASNLKKSTSSIVEDRKSLVSVSTSKTLEKKNKRNISNAEKKFAVYNGAIKKIGIDFDLINILKTIEGFDYFTQVFFEESQQVLFNSVAKPTIKIDTEEEKESKWGEQELSNVVTMYHNLVGMFNEAQGKLEPFQVRLLELMGRTPEEIELVQGLLAGEDIKAKINHELQDSVETKNEIMKNDNIDLDMIGNEKEMDKEKDKEKEKEKESEKDKEKDKSKDKSKDDNPVNTPNTPEKKKSNENEFLAINDIDIENEIDAIFNKETPQPGNGQQGKDKKNP